jgi:hypothetical protein
MISSIVAPFFCVGWFLKYLKKRARRKQVNASAIYFVVLSDPQGKPSTPTLNAVDPQPL